jgi:ADP-ribose pyrophosphatase YjhB (NUDIX family)
MTKTKISYGIALCKSIDNKIEVMMIQKRFTYAFFNFVWGKYNKFDPSFKKMFDKMTYEEKICILNMEFEDIWFRLWLNKPIKDKYISDHYFSRSNNLMDINTLYNKKKAIFENNFIRYGGNLLKKTILLSKTATTKWEMPKGSINEGETMIDCAMREFYEETGISDTYYDVLYGTKPIVECIVEDEVIYKHYYYLATPRIDFQPRFKFCNYNQISETKNVQWLSLIHI